MGVSENQEPVLEGLTKRIVAYLSIFFGAHVYRNSRMEWVWGW